MDLRSSKFVLGSTKSENNRSKPAEGSADIADKWIRPTKGEEEEDWRTGV